MIVDVDVLVVGAGPAGSTLAALLARRGVSVLVVEADPEVYPLPRAAHLDGETARTLRETGAWNDERVSSTENRGMDFLTADHRLLLRMTSPATQPGCLPNSNFFHQPSLDRAMRVAAESRGATLMLGARVTGFEDHGKHVTVDIESLDGSRSTRTASWLVGCCGARSFVRKTLGVTQTDLDFDEPWLVVDVRVNERGLARLPRTSVQFCEPGRPCTMVIGPGNHRRWEISLNPGEDPRQAATPEGTWALLRRWITPEDGELWRQSSYRFHALVARQWRAGRVFVAGDAAHMQPPFLGQGMCQGVRDAVNLAWKLAAVIQGRVRGGAAQALLDSYGTERQAHVRTLTTRLKSLGAIICERDPVRAKERDDRLLAECGGIVRDTPRQDVLPRLETGLLAVAGGTGRGTLFPQPRLEGGELMDQRFGSGWRLVLDASLAMPADVDEEVTVVALDAPGIRETEGVVSAWMLRHYCRAALVRPDNYVYGTAADAAGVASLLAQRRAALGC